MPFLWILRDLPRRARLVTGVRIPRRGATPATSWPPPRRARGHGVHPRELLTSQPRTAPAKRGKRFKTPLAVQTRSRARPSRARGVTLAPDDRALEDRVEPFDGIRVNLPVRRTLKAREAAAGPAVSLERIASSQTERSAGSDQRAATLSSTASQRRPRPSSAEIAALVASSHLERCQPTGLCVG